MRKYIEKTERYIEHHHAIQPDNHKQIPLQPCNYPLFLNWVNLLIF